MYQLNPATVIKTIQGISSTIEPGCKVFFEDREGVDTVTVHRDLDRRGTIVGVPRNHLEIEPKTASMWEPEQDPLVLGVVGKLGEEATELAKACFRIVIQGRNGVDPRDGKPNMAALYEEVCDVEATIHALKNRIAIDPEVYHVNKHRVTKKINFKGPWFDWLAKWSRTGTKPAA